MRCHNYPVNLNLDLITYFYIANKFSCEELNFLLKNEMKEKLIHMIWKSLNCNNEITCCIRVPIMPYDVLTHKFTYLADFRIKLNYTVIRETNGLNYHVFR